MSITSVNSVKVKLNFSNIAYLTLHGCYLCFGWAVLFIDIVPFPLFPLLFHYGYQHLTLIYHALLEQQGSYTFTDKESDDHRDWVVTRVLWLSRSLSVIYAKNEYAGRYFYLFSDTIDIKKHHQLMVLLR